MILTPLNLKQKPDIKSVNCAKFIRIDKKLVPIEDVDLKEFAKAYFESVKEKITKEKVEDFINNF